MKGTQQRKHATCDRVATLRKNTGLGRDHAVDIDGYVDMFARPGLHASESW